jgi:hypothetical protein
MPIQHVVMFRFREGTEPSAVDELASGLRRLPSLIPQIATYALGPDLGLSDGSWDFALSARFASAADFETYRAHPEHQAVVSDLIEPVTAERRSVQFEY